jgi:hypothetical protein
MKKESLNVFVDILPAVFVYVSIYVLGRAQQTRWFMASEKSRSKCKENL